jgi:large subunit ribosomal protein L3
MRSRGRVIKNKKMPGHMGVEQRVMKNLTIVRLQPETNIVLIKGSVPGKTGSLVFLKKRG